MHYSIEWKINLFILKFYFMQCKIIFLSLSNHSFEKHFTRAYAFTFYIQILLNRLNYILIGEGQPIDEFDGYSLLLIHTTTFFDLQEEKQFSMHIVRIIIH